MILFKRSIFYITVFICVWTAFAFYIRDKYTVPILMYHQVDACGTSKCPLNIVSPEAFDRQMKFLKKNNYQVISLDDLIQGIAKGVLFNRRSVVITFDDGYADNYTTAFPVLKRYDFPALVFVVSDFVGKPGYVTWDNLKEMQGSGFVTGSHTRNHLYLPEVKDHTRLVDEIVTSKKILEDNIGREIDYFSYPSGGYSEEIKDIVKSAKYKGACATNRGYDRFNTSRYELKRVRMNDTDSNLVMLAKVSGYYNLFRDFKSTH